MKPGRSFSAYWTRLTITTLVSLCVASGSTTIWASRQRADGYLHPLRQISSTQLLKEKGISVQEVSITTRDGVQLSAWYTPPHNGSVILVAHKFGGPRPEDIYLLFAEKGYGVLAWDFRAQGQSGGDFSSFGHYEVLDAEAALDFVLSQHGIDHIGAWGGSMGAVTMILTAAKRTEIEAVVADSPFASLEDEMQLLVPFPVMNSLVRYFMESESGWSFDEVRPIDEIAKISPRPVFLIQGLDDDIIPIDSASRLYEAAGEPRMLWLEDGVPHLYMFAYKREQYAEQVIGFFDKYLAGN